MNHLRYCLAEELRRQDLERNVAQHRLVKQVRMGTGVAPRRNHRFQGITSSETAGVVILSESERTSA